MSIQIPVQEKSWILIGVLVTQGHMLPSFHGTLTVCTPSTLPVPTMIGLGPRPPLPLPPHLRAPTLGAWEDSQPAFSRGILGGVLPVGNAGLSRRRRWLAPGTSGNSGLCLVTPRFPLFAAQPWRQPIPSRVVVTTCSGQVACVTSRP